jgi:hypothetical protein
VDNALAWDGNWAWSLPLIVVTVIYHVIALAFINQKLAQATRFLRRRHSFLFVFALVMGTTTLWATLLHAIEASLWAAVYLMLGALSDGKSALLYSLSAMTTYGHEPSYLADHWRLMGALEALNGMLLFGLTTAFLYAMIREVWPSANGTAPDQRLALTAGIGYEEQSGDPSTTSGSSPRCSANTVSMACM